LWLKLSNFKKHYKMEIRLNVKDNLLSDFGIIHIQEFLQRQLQIYELQLSANKISKYLKKSKEVDWEMEFDEAKQKAWDEYQQKFFSKE